MFRKVLHAFQWREALFVIGCVTFLSGLMVFDSRFVLLGVGVLCLFMSFWRL
jgi:hypothetical protein